LTKNQAGKIKRKKNPEKKSSGKNQAKNRQSYPVLAVALVVRQRLLLYGIADFFQKSGCYINDIIVKDHYHHY